MMIKLTLSEQRGWVLLNPAHITSVCEMKRSCITAVYLVDGKMYEVCESVALIQSMTKGGAE